MLISHVIHKEILYSLSVMTCHFMGYFKSYIIELTFHCKKVVYNNFLVMCITKGYMKRLCQDMAFIPEEINSNKK